MKITFCAYDTTENIDGPTAWMKRLFPYLRQHGIQVRILIFGTHKKNLPAYNYFTSNGFECKLISWWLFYEEKVLAILEDIKNNPPDIFIPNYFPFSCGAAKWVKQSGIPTIMVLHNDNNFHYELVEEYATKKNEQNISAIVGVSKLMIENIYSRGVEHNIVYTIPYGAPVSAEIATPPTDERLSLVYAGRIMKRQKRILDVAHAFCRVAREIPGTVCHIYGSGLNEGELKKMLATEGKGLAVNFGGQLESNSIQQYFLQNHIFVLLSEFEGLPISLMEAMGCGLVPVCTNIRSGISELIEDGKNGILVNDRDDAFVQAIKKLKKDKALWQAMSIAAKEKIVNEYSEEACNKKWLQLLHQLHKNAPPKKALAIPSVKEIKKSVSVNKEFKGYCDTRPSILFLPLYKGRALLSKLKRKLLYS